MVQEEGRPYKELTDEDILAYDMLDNGRESEEQILKKMGERMSPKDFVSRSSNTQDAAVIDPKGNSVRVKRL